MHYYSFNIKDYRKDTQHLKPMEHYIYRMLIDLYYMDEKPIPNKTQWVMRRLMLDSPEHQIMLENVLDDFFYECDDGFRHKRIEKEIAAYHSNVEKNRKNGAKGGRPRKNNPEITQSVTDGSPLDSQNNPNQEPLTNNHKPSINNNNTDFSIVSIQHWQQPNLTDVNAMIKLGLSVVPDITQSQYDYYIAKFKNYYAEEEAKGLFIQTDARRKDLLAEWIERDYQHQKKNNAKAKPIANSSSASKTDWSKVGTKPDSSNSDMPDVYHPSHSKPVTQAKPNPETSVMVNGLFKAPFPNMSRDQSYEYISCHRMPGEMADEAYDRLLKDMRETV